MRYRHYSPRRLTAFEWEISTTTFFEESVRLFSSLPFTFARMDSRVHSAQSCRYSSETVKQ